MPTLGEESMTLTQSLSSSGRRLMLVMSVLNNCWRIGQMKVMVNALEVMFNTLSSMLGDTHYAQKQKPGLNTTTSCTHRPPFDARRGL